MRLARLARLDADSGEAAQAGGRARALACNARDHLVDVEFRRPSSVFTHFNARPASASQSEMALSKAPQTKAAQKTVLPCLLFGSHPRAPITRQVVRATARALFVATAADVGSAARSEETVERRDHFSAGQPAIGIRLGVQPFPFSAGAASANGDSRLSPGSPNSPKLIN